MLRDIAISASTFLIFFSLKAFRFFALHGVRRAAYEKGSIENPQGTFLPPVASKPM
jgi:hypothetical protein